LKKIIFVGNILEKNCRKYLQKIFFVGNILEKICRKYLQKIFFCRKYLQEIFFPNIISVIIASSKIFFKDKENQIK